MTQASCFVHASGRVELYFYGELREAERRAVEEHLASCPGCRQALEELLRIQSALAARPQVLAPPGDDWAAFMARLNGAVAREREQPPAPTGHALRGGLALLALAALLTLVTISVLLVSRESPGTLETSGLARGVQGEDAVAPPLASIGQQHLERSKLVLLGLAGRDADETAPADWYYERELASRLLDDTRLYRLAAERDGLSTMAEVMRDLEFVLLQASLTEGRDRSELTQIQRAIRKRDLLQKMGVVRTGL
jgi:hypothetical protein